MNKQSAYIISSLLPAGSCHYYQNHTQTRSFHLGNLETKDISKRIE